MTRAIAANATGTPTSHATTDQIELVSPFCGLRPSPDARRWWSFIANRGPGRQPLQFEYLSLWIFDRAEASRQERTVRRDSQVARTGKGYDGFLDRRRAIVATGKRSLLSYESGAFTSLEQMRWAWKHILAFSPLPQLKHVTCPVLGVWGEVDPQTDATVAASAMREALSKGGNRDVTVKIFPHAGHSLMETLSRKEMAPGVFEYVRQWLLARVHFQAAKRASI